MQVNVRSVTFDHIFNCWNIYLPQIFIFVIDRKVFTEPTKRKSLVNCARTEKEQIILPSKQNSCSLIRSVVAKFCFLRSGLVLSGSYNHEKLDDHFDGLGISASLCCSCAKTVDMNPYL